MKCNPHLLLAGILSVFVATMAVAASPCSGDQDGNLAILDGLVRDSQALSKMSVDSSTEVARFVPSILCRLEKTPWSPAGSPVAKKSAEAFRKTMLNLGKPTVKGRLHPAQMSFNLAHGYLGQLYAIESGRPNPFANFLWERMSEEVNGAHVFLAALIRVEPCPYLKKEAAELAEDLRAHLKNADHLLAAMELPSHVEPMVKQYQTAVQRFLFTLAHKQVREYRRAFDTIAAAWRRLYAASTTACASCPTKD